MIQQGTPFRPLAGRAFLFRAPGHPDRAGVPDRTSAGAGCRPASWMGWPFVPGRRRPQVSGISRSFPQPGAPKRAILICWRGERSRWAASPGRALWRVHPLQRSGLLRQGESGPGTACETKPRSKEHECCRAPEEREARLARPRAQSRERARSEESRTQPGVGSELSRGATPDEVPAGRPGMRLRWSGRTWANKTKPRALRGALAGPLLPSPGVARSARGAEGEGAAGDKRNPPYLHRGERVSCHGAGGPGLPGMR